ncbi:Helix-hairpin-helix motif-containing protein [Fodinibius roseus]|uniref:Helix-hairpin-helix motif-containing protein n=1 Tax=Fodinibius roseus TaxID=1194090 RepID=A0A1M5C2B2_9BACT|nr:helix-hairpin-helix domain-containing protein [Fodinibius roseus]SHF48800.1 Helix-hairpin-helix motif-containing protein [Fodinibius roseus]
MNDISRLIANSILVVLLMGVAACGGNESGEQEEAQQNTETSAEPTITAAAPETKMNINTASEEKFRTIPNVGDKMVHEFEEYRPYVSIEQFRKEIGKYVDEDRVAAYEQYIFVPVDVNNSDAATLQQLPGVNAEIAKDLIDGRPYDSNNAFTEALASHVSEEQLQTAEKYLKSQ